MNGTGDFWKEKDGLLVGTSNWHLAYVLVSAIDFLGDGEQVSSISVLRKGH